MNLNEPIETAIALKQDIPSMFMFKPAPCKHISIHKTPADMLNSILDIPSARVYSIPHHAIVDPDRLEAYIEMCDDLKDFVSVMDTLKKTTS